MRNSADQKIRDAGVQTRSGRKWSAATAVDKVESMPGLQEIIGTTCRSKEGIGVSHFQQWAKADKTEKRSMVKG